MEKSFAILLRSLLSFRPNQMKIEILNQDQIHQLHQASVRILKEMGVQIPHPHVRQLFLEAGAREGSKPDIVCLPPSLVDQCLATAGRSFTLYGRDRRQQARFGAGARNYNSSAGQALWVEDSGRERRYASLPDVITAGRLGDALPGITLVGAMSDPHEIPVQWRCVEVAATLLEQTAKPVFFFFHDRASARYVIELLTAVAGSEEEAARYPLTFAFLEPISPLRFPYQGLDLLFETARLSLPVVVGPMAQMGVSAPCSLAGTLAQENAEVLAGICATQLIKPGLPVCYGGICHAFDMRTTQILFGGPEQALMGIAMTQMGKHYGFPVYVNTGLTDSKLPDAQAGLESGITLFSSVLAGADIFGHFGICGADQGASLLMLLVQHELIGFIERIMAGLEVSDDLLGFDVLRAVGHGGSFLAEDHTSQNFRKQLWFPKLLDRQYWANWRQAGAADLRDRALAMKDRLIENHAPQPLAPSLRDAMRKIVAAASKHLE